MRSFSEEVSVKPEKINYLAYCIIEKNILSWKNFTKMPSNKALEMSYSRALEEEKSFRKEATIKVEL